MTTEPLTNHLRQPGEEVMVIPDTERVRRWLGHSGKGVYENRVGFVTTGLLSVYRVEFEPLPGGSRGTHNYFPPDLLITPAEVERAHKMAALLAEKERIERELAAL